MTRRKTATTASLPSEITNVAPFGNRCGSKSKRTLAWRPRHYLSGRRENMLAGTRTARFGPCSGESSRVARSDCHMFEMPIIRAVGTYFSLRELAMMRHSGVMP